jgi:hypothetical protein
LLTGKLFEKSRTQANPVTKLFSLLQPSFHTATYEPPALLPEEEEEEEEEARNSYESC